MIKEQTILGTGSVLSGMTTALIVGDPYMVNYLLAAVFGVLFSLLFKKNRKGVLKMFVCGLVLAFFGVTIVAEFFGIYNPKGVQLVGFAFGSTGYLVATILFNLLYMFGDPKTLKAILERYTK